ncbi:VanZ family protein [Actinoplanes sp. NPDC089786]|uniref:VanZ family protein n=1 Tax=Actinoplanes sp. NPDC089786 TaxID=3155185 RepID=UPI0034342BE8
MGAAGGRDDYTHIGSEDGLIPWPILPAAAKITIRPGDALFSRERSTSMSGINAVIPTVPVLVPLVGLLMVAAALWHRRRAEFAFTRLGTVWLVIWLVAATACIAVLPVRVGTGGLGDPDPVPVLLPFLAIPLFGAAWWLRRRGERSFVRLGVTWLLTWYTAAVISLTLLPMQIQTGDFANHTPWQEKGIHLNPFVHDVTPVNFAFNILMTVPLGLLLPIAIRRRGVVVAALLGLAFSASIEIVQAVTNIVFSSGRSADVYDLIANTVGALIGVGLLRILDSAGATRWLDADQPAQAERAPNQRAMGSSRAR